MILAALLLQAAEPPAMPPAPAATPAATLTPAAPPRPRVPLSPIEAAAAVDLFKAACVATFDAPDTIAPALAALPLGLVEQPRVEGRPAVWRSRSAVVSRSDARCAVFARLRTPADQLTFAARVAGALALSGGRTRTAKDQAVTAWPARTTAGTAVRVTAATRNDPAGGSNVILSVSPAAP